MRLMEPIALKASQESFLFLDYDENAYALNAVVNRKGRSDEEIDLIARQLKVMAIAALKLTLRMDVNYVIRYKILDDDEYAKIESEQLDKLAAGKV